MGSGFEKGVSHPLRWVCVGSRECTGRGVTAIGASQRRRHFLGKEDQALKGALEGKEGLTEGWARGEGL